MSRKIVIIVEGDTELAMHDSLPQFLQGRAGKKPKVGLEFIRTNGLLTKTKVSAICGTYIDEKGVLGIIALSDVYPMYNSSASAKQTLRSWMPYKNCFAHVACYDIEASLLANWKAIELRCGKKVKPFGLQPETINSHKPPSKRLAELYRKNDRFYNKRAEGKYFFDRLEWEESAAVCPELKSFLNTLLILADYPLLP